MINLGQSLYEQIVSLALAFLIFQDETCNNVPIQPMELQALGILPTIPQLGR